MLPTYNNGLTKQISFRTGMLQKIILALSRNA